MEFVLDEITKFMKAKSNGDVGLSFEVDFPNSDSEKRCLTVIKIEEETTLKNKPNVSFDASTAKHMAKKPKVSLNYYLMFSCSNSYKDSIKSIYKVISFFQKFRRITTGYGTQVRMDLFSPSFEQVNQVWSLHGGKLYPHVMYKASVFEFEHDSPAEIEESIHTVVTTINHEN